MKRVLLYFLFSLLCPALMSQMVYFFSIDADASQPFTLQTGNQIVRSSATGHLLLPHLKDSIFVLNISFPEDRYPRHRFQVLVNKKDRGFQLKKRDASTWALYDWQQAEWIPVLTEQSLNEPTGEKRDDAFAHLMAGVVNDTSVLYSQRQNGIPNDSLKAVKVEGMGDRDLAERASREEHSDADSILPADSSPKVLQDTTQEISSGKKSEKDIKADAVVPWEPGKKAALIRRLGDSVLRDTRYLLYCDSNETGIDTIAVRIPMQEESTLNRKEPKVTVPAKQTVIANKKETVKTPPESKDSTFKKTPAGNNGCLNMASEADVDKLRFRMLQETTPDGRLEVARKAFRAQCFSTRQIRALTELFFSDENRYRFFDAAYPSAADKEPFKALVFFLTDDYYISRFKAMVRY